MELQKNLTNRQKKSIETKNNLFKSAIRLFAEKGYDNVTVDEIVAKAGTSKGAFYTYFKSKYQVIIEQFKEIDKHYVKIRKNLNRYKTSRDKLLYFVKEQHTFTKNEMGLEVTRIVYTSQLLKDEEKFIVNEKRPFYKIIKTIIEEGQESGEFRNDISSDELTDNITRCMRASFFDWCVHNGKYDFVEDGIRFFDKFILNALMNHEIT